MRACKLKWMQLYPVMVIALSCILSFSVRLFSIIKFESIIHEFDPWFNYRSTLELVNNGFYHFLNWFDDKAWYPLGRIVGGTIYPGLMLSAGCLHSLLHLISFTVDIRNVCVLLAPLFSCCTLIAAFLLTRELWNTEAGLICATLMAIIPGYISRSSSGSYDNEGIAIFAMLLTFYLWIKALKTGSIYWSLMCSFAYFYMVSAWGGYVYIINLISLHAVILLIFQKYSSNLYVSFSVFYLFGLMFSMQVPFVGFQSLKMNENISATCAFLVIQVYHVLYIFTSSFSNKNMLKYLYFTLACFGTCLFGIFYLTRIGILSPWSGRFYSLWDTTYASVNIPIITSVSEHQPTAWHSTFSDLSILMCFYPAGIWFCFRDLNDERIFLIIYAVTASYFSGIMVRLVLALTPVVCISSSIAMNSLINYTQMQPRKTKEYENVNEGPPEEIGVTSSGDKTEEVVNLNEDITKEQINIRNYFSGVICAVLLVFVCFHSTHVTSSSYSSPSIVLATDMPDGSQIIIDDFREAYYWLRQNTAEDARIISWWDYGYQITGLANRTTIVDNNTWNNSHIALVGKAMASNESVAIEIMRQLDVDYVLVVFGGLLAYSGDDINKFLWMVRISEGEYPKEIFEFDYYTATGDYRVDRTAPRAMLDSLMYRLSYFRFGEVKFGYHVPLGYDRVRHSEIGLKDFWLQHFEEAYTTDNWMVRIYRTRSVDNRPRARAPTGGAGGRGVASHKNARTLKGVLNHPGKVVKGIKKRYYAFIA